MERYCLNIILFLPLLGLPNEESLEIELVHSLESTIKLLVTDYLSTCIK